MHILYIHAKHGRRIKEQSYYLRKTKNWVIIEDNINNSDNMEQLFTTFTYRLKPITTLTTEGKKVVYVSATKWL